MKCENCWREVEKSFPDVIYNDWLKLMNYFEHEYDEDEITEQTYNRMVDALMAIKPKQD